MPIQQVMTDFVTVAIQTGGWMELDRMYLMNRLAKLLGVSLENHPKPAPVALAPSELATALVRWAQDNQRLANTPAAEEVLYAQLMELLTPPPSVVNAFFAKNYEKHPEKATTYLQQIGQTNQQIYPLAQQNLAQWTAPDNRLRVQIQKQAVAQTINQHAKLGEQAQPPHCLCCLENEGFAGNSHYPIQLNQRFIRMNLAGESWHLQPANYPSYAEQSFVCTEDHQQTVSFATICARLADLAQLFPHYVASYDTQQLERGLASQRHPHLQVGRPDFPILQAPIEEYFSWPEFPLMNSGVVSWPIPTLRLQSPNAEDVVAASQKLAVAWQQTLEQAAVPHVTFPHLLMYKEQGLTVCDVLFYQLANDLPKQSEAAFTDLDVCQSQPIQLLTLAGCFQLAAVSVQNEHVFLSSDMCAESPSELTVQQQAINQACQKLLTSIREQTLSPLATKDLGEWFTAYLQENPTN